VSWSGGVATVDNVAAANIAGNIGIASVTNALKNLTAGMIAIGGTNVTASAVQLNNAAATVTVDAGDLTAGNLGIARMTNALSEAGSYIGGNIAEAALTNVLGAVRYSGIVTNGGVGSLFTNILTYVDGICTAATLNP